MLEEQKKRVTIVFAMFVFFFAIVFARVSYLSLKSIGEKNSGGAETIRGNIEDRRGLVLAFTEEASTIALAPPEIVDPEFTAENLSRYLSLDYNDILKKIYIYQDKKYFLLQRRVDNFTADRIMQLNLPGVHRESEFRRFYPGESLASNLIGFVSRDQRQALGGLEFSYDHLLRTPLRRIHRKGPDLRITIDSLIQYRLESAMKSSFEKSGSKRAVGIIMDVKNGEIVALANYPNFNPNKYYRSTPFQRGNWAIRLNYEPGSTVKIFMAGILMMEQAVSEDETFLCNGEFRTDNIVIRDTHGSRVVSYGRLNLAGIIKKSSNVGIIQAMQRIRKDRLHHYMTELGFGRKTGILPPGSGETAGYFPTLEQWVPSTGYYMPIGQGFSVTPIQLLRAVSSVANGGEMVEPRIEYEIRDPSGSVEKKFDSKSKANPFSEEVNRKVREMMVGVVEEGTGRRASLKEIQIGGKTGTGQKSSATGYTDRVVASFVGFFPARDPKYAGLILFDEPDPEYASGGGLAAPVFGEFVSSALPLIQTGYRTEEVPELPTLKTSRPNVNRESLFDFKGLSARESIGILADYYGLPVELHGSGYVYKQSPEPGTPVQKVKKVELYLEDY